jgi:hypothetical protein
MNYSGGFPVGNKNQKAMMPELTDEITLCNELFSKCCHDELREIDKHEIIVKICQIIGSTPENLCKAEEVFNTIKYDITKYTLHHEYCSETKNQVKPKFLLWLDSKAEPKKARELSNFLDKYLK